MAAARLKTAERPLDETSRAEAQTFLAPAKINLYLKVLGRRSDGYHELDSVMAKLDLADRVQLDFFQDGERDQLIAGAGAGLALPDGFDGPGNLALKAVGAFRALCGWPRRGVRIVLEKNIPLGAGLGGGSSDCAAVLKALNASAPQPLSRDDLEALGLSLGADVPFFIQPKAVVRIGGIGEVFKKPQPFFNRWPGRAILLVNPGLHLSTAEVFKNLGLTNEPANNNLGPVSEPGPGDNDLFEAAARLVPDLRAVAQAVKAAKPVFWGMSGSGSTFWACQPHEAEKLPLEHPDWLVRRTAIMK